jgi:hypothetical protein
MAFSFGFTGDDIDIDDSELHEEGVHLAQTEDNGLPALVPAQKHDIKEWVSGYISWDHLVSSYSRTAPTSAQYIQMMSVNQQLTSPDPNIPFTNLLQQTCD